MPNFAAEPWLTILDKGLLAAILATFAWVFNRSLERLKNWLSWRNELLKEHLAEAKSILRGLNAIEAAHRAIVLSTQSGFTLGTAEFERFMNAKTIYWEASRNARLLLSKEAMQAAAGVNDTSTELVRLLQRSLAGERDLHEELTAQQSALEHSMEDTIARLQREFEG